MADLGFPVRGGGRGPRRGGMDSQGGHISKILYVKTKESGPLGGGGVRQACPPLDPPMLSDNFHIFVSYIYFILISLTDKILFLLLFQHVKGRNIYLVELGLLQL